MVCIRESTKPRLCSKLSLFKWLADARSAATTKPSWPIFTISESFLIRYCMTLYLKWYKKIQKVKVENRAHFSKTNHVWKWMILAMSLMKYVFLIIYSIMKTNFRNIKLLKTLKLSIENQNVATFWHPSPKRSYKIFDNLCGCSFGCKNHFNDFLLQAIFQIIKSCFENIHWI